ncbi:MFS transporter, partial [Algoriphagus ratkowskyi]
SSLGIRLLAGRTSDRYGRIPVMQAASITLVAAMVLIAFAESKFGLLGSGVLFGCAVGMYSPTTAAWVVDLSLDQFRGRALATMYIALEAGIGIGALVSGYLFANNPENFRLVFLSSAGFAGLAFIVLLFVKRDRKSEILEA